MGKPANAAAARDVADYWCRDRHERDLKMFLASLELPWESPSVGTAGLKQGLNRHRFSLQQHVQACEAATLLDMPGVNFLRIVHT